MEALKYKVWVGWLAFAFIVLHFGLILAYALPTKFTNPVVTKFAAPYVEPVFMQRWSLFAPCPKLNSKIEIKFYFDSDSTDWINPVENAVKEHAFYRGSYHGELVLASSNIVYWLSLDLDEMGVGAGDSFPMDRAALFIKGYSYFKIKNYISGNARYLYNKSPLKASMRVWLNDVQTQEEGMLTLPMFNY